MQRAAYRRLLILDAADFLLDLRRPPGNRLEALAGDRLGQHSIRINDEWRVCFVWTPAGAEDVEILDYHLLKGKAKETKEGTQMNKAHAPIHPGEILLEEFLLPYGVSQYELAKTVGVPARRINEIVHGKRAITPDTALRLARAFDISDRFFLNLQARYDLEVESDRLADVLPNIKPLKAVS